MRGKIVKMIFRLCRSEIGAAYSDKKYEIATSRLVTYLSGIDQHVAASLSGLGSRNAFSMLGVRGNDVHAPANAR